MAKKQNTTIEHDKIILANDEYVICHDDPIAIDYEVYYKGKKIDYAVGLILKGGR